MTTMIQTIERASELVQLSSVERCRAARKRRRVIAPVLLLLSLLPFVFLCWVFMHRYHYLYLPLPWRFGDWLYAHADIIAVSCFLLVCHWLFRHPARRYFRGSVLWWAVYCLVPEGGFMLLVFSQRHPVIAGVILLAAFVACYKMYTKDKSSDPKDSRTKRKKTAQRYRAMAIAFLAVMLVPSVLSISRYKMLSESVEYQHIFTEAIGDVMLEHIEAVNDRTEVYEKHGGVFDALSSWEQLSPHERQDAIVGLIEMECELNRIPNMLSEVKFVSTEEGTLGYYNAREKSLCLSIQAMNNFGFEWALESALHEFYHYYQQYICSLFDGDDGIGWDSPLATDEYRLWRANQTCYLQASEVGMEGYESQPLELSAREFAEEEYDRLMEALGGGENE